MYFIFFSSESEYKDKAVKQTEEFEDEAPIITLAKNKNKSPLSFMLNPHIRYPMKEKKDVRISPFLIPFLSAKTPTNGAQIS